MIQTGLIECPLCDAREARSLFVKEGKSFVKCDRCGLVYQKEPSSAEENKEYYRKNYYASFGRQIEKINEGRLSLYRDILARCSAERAKGRLLDIGCGYGDFLKLAEEDGWEAWGIEPSQAASESAGERPGLRILNQAIEAVDFQENHFDVITLWNVIDCLPDPVGAMRKIYRWLSPGGRLIIRTPNVSFHMGIYHFYLSFRSLLKRMGWTREASVFLKTNYQRKTLKRLLGQAGFSDVRIENGMPTAGDAYQVFSRSTLASAAKSFLYGIARWVGWVSGNRLLIGSNLIAWASKETLQSKYSPLAIRVRIVVKKLILHILAVVGYLLGLPLWWKWLGKDREIRILLYHCVSEFRKSDINVKQSRFREQMDFLKTRYGVVSLEQAIEFLEARKLPKPRTVVITFDDGYEDNYKVAYPILRERKLSATVFLLTGLEGPQRQVTHLEGDLPQYNRLLSWEEVREMASSGITFGSHGETHGRLTDMSSEKARFEFEISKKKIESQISRPVQFFSYPYGTSIDFNRRLESFAREAGYRAAFSAISGTNAQGANRFALRRIGIEASDTLFTFQAKLNGALDLLRFFDLTPMRKIIRKLDSLFLKKRPSKAGSKPPLLLVSVDFPPHKDGISTISRELSTRIAQWGREVWVIGPSDSGEREFDAAQPYRVFRVIGYEWGRLRFLPLFLFTPFVFFPNRIRKILAMSVSYGGVLAWMFSFIVRIEYLVFAHGYEYEKVKGHPFAHPLYRSIFRRAKKVIANSDAIRERLILFGVPGEQIEVLHPAVDANQYRPREVPSSYLARKRLTGRKILLTVGRLIERKGHDRVVQALPRITQHFPDVLYCIVGVGPEEKNLRDQIRSLNLEDRVRFLGKVSDEELALLYNACDIFVMPSREILTGGHIEGFGIVYLEAGASAKPVIGGRSGGIHEAVQEGKTGLLVDPHSSAQIAEKITDLLSHPEKARAMGESGRQWVLENFSWENYARRVWQLMDHDDTRA